MVPGFDKLKVLTGTRMEKRNEKNKQTNARKKAIKHDKKFIKVRLEQFNENVLLYLNEEKQKRVAQIRFKGNKKQSNKIMSLWMMALQKHVEEDSGNFQTQKDGYTAKIFASFYRITFQDPL